MAAFYDFKDVITDQGDVAIIIKMDLDTQDTFYISAYMDFDSISASTQDISYSYLTACDPSVTGSNVSTSTYISLDFTGFPMAHVPTSFTYTHNTHAIQPTKLRYPLEPTNTHLEQVSTFATKHKYKLVALKVHLVLADLPDKFHITRNIVGNPLVDMPQLSPTPPPFQPTGRYNEANHTIIDKVHTGNFLWPGE